MAILLLSTLINAPRERVFDLARSIDVHQKSTEQTDERAVAGVTTGLIAMNEEVTWEAHHLGIKQRLTVRITAFERPNHFQDVMVRGAFRRMIHDHTFVQSSCGTEMIDRFEFDSPLGILGKIVDQYFLCRYMRRLLEQRNRVLKHLAESNEWQKYIEMNGLSSC
jgi:ligand-binding SRPBCC domain-containing protein